MWEDPGSCNVSVVGLLSSVYFDHSQQLQVCVPGTEVQQPRPYTSISISWFGDPIIESAGLGYKICSKCTLLLQDLLQCTSTLDKPLKKKCSQEVVNTT